MSDAIAPVGDRGVPTWALAAASYLARYSGNTRTTYTTSLRLAHGAGTGAVGPKAVTTSTPMRTTGSRLTS